MTLGHPQKNHHSSSIRMPFRSKKSLQKTSRCNQHPSSSNVQYIAPIVSFFLKMAISPFEDLVFRMCHWFLWTGEISRMAFGFHSCRNWTPKPAEVRLAMWYVRLNWIQAIPSGIHEDTESINVRIRPVIIRRPIKWTPRSVSYTHLTLPTILLV